jgi:CubicO group peptidase (beta-lactamase class C family)
MRVTIRIHFFVAAVLTLIAVSTITPEAAAQTTALTTQQPQARRAQIPATPAGRQFSEWLKAFNTGDQAAIQNFIDTHFSERALKHLFVEERLKMDLTLYQNTHGLVPYRVEAANDTDISVLTQAKVTEDWVRVRLQVMGKSDQELEEEEEHKREIDRARDAEEDHDPKIVRFTFNLVEPPSDAVSSESLSQDQISPRIESYLDKLAAADVFSGAVIVAREGKPIFQKAYGLANQKSKLPNQLDTKFNIGPLGKMFTAVAIAQLAEQGKLSFEDTLDKHLPDYPNQEVAKHVTIHELLTHTSGLGDYFNPRYGKSKDSLRTVSDYFPLFVNDPPEFTPGQKWRYSNAGYIVLGAIIEKESGQSYFDYVKSHLFKPAGMTNTDYYEVGQDTPNLAVGYTNITRDGQLLLFPRQENVTRLQIKGGPAGGGYSTVEDLLKFDIALRNHKLLNSKFTDVVLAGKVDLGGEGSRAAYGFVDQKVNGKRIVGEGGGFPGANGRFDMYLDLGYSVAALSNYDPPSAQRVTNKLRAMITNVH